MSQIKIATCCYCARRTVLKPTANRGHELACGSCGAPLSRMKPLRVGPAIAPSVAAVQPAARSMAQPRLKKRKRRKPLWRKIAEDVWDEIEDIFD